MLRVTELFSSIQGESTYAGMRCAFVRLTGCPLRCTWCDTEYAFYGGRDMSIEAVLTAVREFGCPLVEVTGGEPLQQPEAFTLIERLCSDGYTVLVETSGAIDIGAVDPRAHVILDVKCPGSGMVDRMQWSSLGRLTPKDEVKFVIMDRADYEWAKGVVDEHCLARRCPVLFGPVFGALDPRTLAEWILADRMPVRFQMQLHKYMWAPDARGV